jgi:alpha,alpha-trehalase
VSEQGWTMPFAPLRRDDGYLPIKDHGLIGDCTTAALVGRDGSIGWMCLPRFDAEAVFCGMLDHERGGFFKVAPKDITESRQRYLHDTAVLQTEMRTSGGLVRLTDACTLRSGAGLHEDGAHGRCELLRVVEVVEGTVELEIDCSPRGGCEADASESGLSLCCGRFPDINLKLQSSRKLTGTKCSFEMKKGEHLWITLRWGGGLSKLSTNPEEILHDTITAWHKWIEAFEYEGPQYDLVRRSGLVLKLLDYSPNGALVAAPTSSLPEAIGGERNWDYRYAWIRDVAFSVFALRRIGLHSEGDSFLSWVLGVIALGEPPRVLYNLDGKQPPPEHEDEGLRGYRNSPPVRWGNAAADQRQHDAYGEILDCAYQWADRGANFDGNHKWGRRGAIDEALWKRLHHFIERAGERWRQPDHGIWEVRTPGRTFTYSAALCQVALDRGALLAQRYELPGRPREWHAQAKQICETILKEAWDEKRQSLTEHLGGGNLDASLLCLPLRRVLKATDPKMIATTDAVASHLGAGHGLIYRYLPEESPDGLAGDEGAFLLCSFWLVDNYALQGRIDKALELYDSLCARAGPLGLLSEQIDPESGAFLGNYPQAFSHVGVIASGITLARMMRNLRGGRTGAGTAKRKDEGART